MRNCWVQDQIERVTVHPEGAATRSTVVESGFGASPKSEEDKAAHVADNTDALAAPARRAARAPANPAVTLAGEHVSVLTALADPTRRLLLDTLAGQGEATATTLAARLPVTRQAIVKHLAVLDRARLVAGKKRGREMRYTVRPEPLGATAAWMTKVAHEWDTRLNRIKEIAESD